MKAAIKGWNRTGDRQIFQCHFTGHNMLAFNCLTGVPFIQQRGP